MLMEEVLLEFLTCGRVEKEEADPAVLLLHLLSLDCEFGFEFEFDCERECDREEGEGG